tara:strand:- start:31 stop:576 length:546 start_codon:yes stop_codon:yes gene_type:complete
MTSIIKVDQIQTLAGTAPTAADLGINVTGSVLQVSTYGINDSSVSAGVTKATMQDWTFTKKFSSSNVLVTMHVNYSNTGTTSFDDNSALFLLNVTDNNYLNRRAMYGAPDGWFGTDTSNGYGMSANAGAFEYHKSTASTQLMDTSNTAGTITYRLQASAQNSIFQIGRWADNSITFMEIAG